MRQSREASVADAFAAGQEGKKQPNRSTTLAIAGAAIAAAKHAHQVQKEEGAARREAYEAGTAADPAMSMEDAITHYRAQKEVAAAAAKQRKADRQELRGHNQAARGLKVRAGAEAVGATAALPFGLTFGAVGGISKGIQYIGKALESVGKRVQTSAGEISEASFGALGANISMYGNASEHMEDALTHYNQAAEIRERLKPQQPSQEQVAQPAAHASGPEENQ